MVKVEGIDPENVGSIECGTVPLAIFWAMYDALRELQESHLQLLKEIEELQDRTGITADRWREHYPERFNVLLKYYRSQGHGILDSVKLAKEKLFDERSKARAKTRTD